jgi:adenosylcobinamide-GDP ribazoletransferase
VVLTAVRGAVGFLTRLPVGHSESAWQAFRGAPWAFPVVGYAVGGILAGVVATLLALSELTLPTAVLAYLLCLFGLTGITHLDGVADLGDALVVHGDAADRRDVLTDTTVGVGAVAAVAVTLLGLALGVFAVGRLPIRAVVSVIVAAEVGARVAMASVACLGTAIHDGLGSQFTTRADSTDLLWVGAAAVPAAFLSAPAATLTGQSPTLSAVPAGTLVGAIGGGLLSFEYARRKLDGVNGDVFGAVNDVARVVGLHAGVMVWTLS